MNRARLAPLAFATIVGGVLSTALVVAQAPGAGPARAATASKKKYTPPRASDGHPDLTGVWSYATITPLERPADLADKAFLTVEEAAAYEKHLLEINNKDSRASDKTADVSSAYNDFWWDRGTKIVGTRRTSIITDPENGKLPPLTAEGQARATARAAARAARGPADGPEDRNLAERCLVSLNAGPPIVPSAYNNNIQLFQTRGNIGIFNEMIHNNRIIPLDTRPALDPSVHQWMGDSRGRWEGDTLVIETRNFRVESAFRGASDALVVVERFTRIGPDELNYEFTLTDPHTWTQPWSGQLGMSKIDDKLYEYACHEGNHAMFGMLSGARADEKAAAAKATSKP
jgi:hypothetical protein